MTSSGKTRGLAVAAVGAMALGLLPMTSASAYGVVTSTEMYSQFSGGVSVANDGANKSIHLLATGDPATVDAAQFQYRISGTSTWFDIGSPVAISNGVFSMEWTPSAADYTNMAGKTQIDIQAQGMKGGADVGAAGAVGGVDIGSIATGASVAISTAPGSALGAYDVVQVPGTAPAYTVGDSYTALSGTTSGDSVHLELLKGGAPTAASVTGSNTIKDFSGLVDLGAFSYPAGSSILGATTGVSDDVEPYSIYKQVITSVTATAAMPTVPTGGHTDITVTVKDQNGNPIAGAHVTDERSVVGSDTNTDINGQATFTNFSAGTYKFYVDTDTSTGYQSAKDFQRTVTVSEYAPVATSETLDLSTGHVADNTEPIKATSTVLDQNGNPLVGQLVHYQWDIADTTGANPHIGDHGTATTNSNGKIVLTWGSFGAPGVYTFQAWVEQDGTPGPTSGDVTSSYAVKAGDSQVVWDAGSLAQVSAGTTTALSGTLEIVDPTKGSLIDGATLSKRDVSLTYTPGTQPAAPTAGDSSLKESSPVTTGSDGTFTVHVIDPTANPQQNELGATLVGTTPYSSDSTLTVDYLTDMAVKTVNVHRNPLDTTNGATPGRPELIGVTVKNAAGIPLSNVKVTFTTDHGFFTPESDTMAGLTPSSTPTAAGVLYGSWKNLGTTYTATTDANGHAFATLAIEGDSGFDSSSTVTATVKAEAGGVTGSNTVDFVSTNPLNAGSLAVAFSSDSSNPAILPKAQVGQKVCFDVIATDQFGNRVAGEPIGITSTDPTNAPVSTNGKSNLAGACSTSVTATAAGSAGISGTWATPPSDVYLDADTGTAGFQYDPTSTGPANPAPADLMADSPMVDWYAVDFSNSTFTLTHSTADAVPVGTPVFETLTVLDQFGQGVPGLTGTLWTSTPNGNTYSDGISTGADGTWTSPALVSSATGNMSMYALVYNGSALLSTTPTDTVTFKNAISATLLGHSNGNKDVLKVVTSPLDSGAIVVFKRGHHVIGTGIVGSNGVAKLSVHDRNGRKPTRYIAKVKPTLTAFAAKTNAIWVR